MSDHANAETVRIPEIRLGAKAGSIERISGVVGGLGLLLCVAGFFANRAEFFQSYLFAVIYWGGFALGGLCILLMNNTVGGSWGVTSRRFLEAQIRTLPLVLLFVIILLFGLQYLYAWSRPDLVASNSILKYKHPYLNTPFFIARIVVYFALWLFWGLRLNRMSDQQDRTADPTLVERMRAFSAPGLLIFTVSASFAYIDWILSADTQFFSTVYGAMILVGDVVQSFALTLVVMILASRGDRFGGRINAKILHQIGNMMFAFVIFWTYLTASQLIIVWPANLPQELVWYLDRVGGIWKWLALVTALSMFAIPFCALLSQTRKRDPKRLIRVAIWLLIARIIDLYWIVEPTYRSSSNMSLIGTSHGFSIYWTDFAAFFGVGGIWLYAFLGQLRRRPLLPLHDPRVSAPLRENILPQGAV